MDAAFKLLPLPTAGRDPEPNATPGNLKVELCQAQLGQPVFVINDAAALAHCSQIICGDE
jgi:hypothetical protein